MNSNFFGELPAGISPMIRRSRPNLATKPHIGLHVILDRGYVRGERTSNRKISKKRAGRTRPHYQSTTVAKTHHQGVTEPRARPPGTRQEQPFPTSDA